MQSIDRQSEMVEMPMALVLRDKTPKQRLAIAFGMWQFTRSTLRRRLHADHPDWTAEQVAREVTRRMLHDS